MADYGRLENAQTIVSAQNESDHGRLEGIQASASLQNPSDHARLEGMYARSSMQNIGDHGRLESLYLMVSVQKTALAPSSGNGDLLQGRIVDGRLSLQGANFSMQGGKHHPDFLED